MTETAQLGEVGGLLARLEIAANYIASPMFVAQITQAHGAAVVRANSPWLNREDAAEYARCSASEISRAADAGFFTKHQRGGSPLFLKAEIDAAIIEGRWLSAGKTESGKQRIEMAATRQIRKGTA